MSEQLEKIFQSSDFIKKKFPKNFKPETALIIEKDFDLLKGFKILDEIKFEKIPPDFEKSQKKQGRMLFAKVNGKDVLVYQGRYHYYDGTKMRDIGHTIYVLKYLGIKKIISVDVVGHLNPRFSCGEIAVIYDHINLMGDNPLIGKNENELGLRFPDMSNAYDKDLYGIVYKIFQDKKIRINESVFIGTIGPESETDAEARFYRDIGGDVTGYSLVPENIAAVHCGLKFIGLGLITRELIADKMLEDERTEKEKIKEQKENLKKSVKEAEKFLTEIISRIN